MFTGIVQDKGTVISSDEFDGDIRLVVEGSEALTASMKPGDSVAVNGACLTVIDRDGAGLSFDVSSETLSVTRLGALRTGDTVNLEPALSASDPLGGHFVSGHVDGIAEILSVEPEGRSHRLVIEIPESLGRYIARKGCVTVDGVSLTVNEVNGKRMVINVVPHTWSVTNFQQYTAGTRVHIEVDLVARYLERLMSEREEAPVEDSITTDFLSRQGFAPPVDDDEDRTKDQADQG